jgi:hypothetical protein
MSVDKYITTTTDYNHQIQPIIRRGTHARVMAVDRSIESFLNLQLPQEGCDTSSNVRQVLDGIPPTSVIDSVITIPTTTQRYDGMR